MGSVTVFTKERALAIENGTVVNGYISGNNLVLARKDGTTINTGNVRGPQGPAGYGVVPVDIPYNADLNTYVNSGNFTQILNTKAASGTNYPVPLAGLLEVYIEPGGTMGWQRYTTYHSTTAPSAMYMRNLYNGAWQVWRKALFTTDVLPAGSFGLGAAQPIANNADVVVQLDTTNELVGMTWDDTNYKFNILTSGRYQVNASVTFKNLAGSTGRCECKVFVSGSMKFGSLSGMTTDFSNASCASMLRLNAGDTVQLVTKQNGGSTRSIHNPGWAWLDVVWDSP